LLSILIFSLVKRLTTSLSISEFSQYSVISAISDLVF
jgi:hypothetical protein